METQTEAALRNVEVKARVRLPEKLREVAAKLADTPVVELHQSDQFYKRPAEAGDRLKLRREVGRQSQLVWYSREDVLGPKLSKYRLCPLHDEEQAQKLDQLLADCLGRAGQLKKTRYLYMVGQTRVHLDDVQGLGHFMELEVVLRPDQTIEEGQRVADELLEKLGVSSDDLITGSYMDAYHAKSHS